MNRLLNVVAKAVGVLLVLAAGLSLGGWIGARTALRSTERFLRVVLGAAAVALALKLLLS